MAEKYKVKADYTLLRKKSQVTKKGDVYENDLMTITPLDTLFTNGQEVIYSDSNFKFSVRTDADLRKKHSKDDWLKTEDGEEMWGLNNFMDSPVSDESKVRIKPDYNSIRDFAYYGSAVEMVKAALNHILLYFPAEIYFSDEQVKITDDYGRNIPGLTGKYYVFNDYNIDLEIEYIDKTTVDNEYRYMCLNAINYEEYMSGKTTGNGCVWEYHKNENYKCGDGLIGTATLNGIPVEIFLYNNDKYYVTSSSQYAGKSFRPNEDIITEYFETIDEFENVLLNRESNPIYRAVFETPYQTDDRGVLYTMENYIFPSYNNWNPDLHSMSYSSYVMSLIGLAEYHDSIDSNNIWRMMTHEAIKNLDWTFFRQNEDATEDLSNIDTSKIEPIIQLYGRQYDGLKRYIDNIKNANKVSYDEKNNVPDYELTDLVGLSGFEPYLPNPTAKTSVFTDKPLFPSMSNGSSEVDGNIGFMRNLKLNSHYILSSKGTRHGIESMLGLLGLKDNEFRIDEYVTVAKGTELCRFIDKDHPGGHGYPSAEDVVYINTSKDSAEINTFNDEDFAGISCSPVAVYNSGFSIDYTYVVPWYENGKQYDNNLYFQEKGGWGLHRISLSGLTIQGRNVIAQTLIGYSETQNRMKYAENIDRMLSFLPSEVKEGDICYVANIETLKDDRRPYNPISEIPNDENEWSHYFVLENASHISVLGKVNDKYGWKYISLNEILNGSSDYGKKVLYLETIKETTIANNPHFAPNGEYDGGEMYIRKLNSIFCDGSNFSAFSDDDVDIIVDSGTTGPFTFGISGKTIYNRKVDYFKPRENSDNPLIKIDSGEQVWNIDLDKHLEDNECFGEDCQEKACEKIELFNQEKSGNTSEVPASYSLVNLKNIEISFANQPSDCEDKDLWKEYIDNVVIEYVKQLLPSTTIFGWNFNLNCDEDKESVNITATGVLEQDNDYIQCGITATGVLEQENDYVEQDITATGVLEQTNDYFIRNIIADGTLEQESGGYINKDITANGVLEQENNINIEEVEVNGVLTQHI